MNSQPNWEEIASAPHDRNLELAVIESDGAHPLVFACRRTADGWINASTRERILVDPSHWRLWSKSD